MTEIKYPKVYASILEDSIKLGFTLMSDPRTGSLLRILAASKLSRRILEIGTGTGISTSWILDSISDKTSVDSIEIDPVCLSIAKRHLGHNKNLRLYCTDAQLFIEKIEEKYDLIFADTFVGKFTHRKNLLTHLNIGGYYIIDDLLPQSTWTGDGHAEKVAELIQDLELSSNLETLFLDWASGIMVCVKIS